MTLGLLGKKLGNTHLFNQKGEYIPVTVIEAGPCFVVQIKKKEQDGYDAVQLGFDDKREKITKKPDMGHFKKAGIAPKRFVREIRVADTAGYTVGQKVGVDMFVPGDYLDVTGTSIGRGFQGGMKRWGWKGGPSGHGSMFHRAPGGIQSGPRLARVTKGKHMPGHMGNRTVTVQNLELVNIDKDSNLLVVKGCVPGHKNGYLIIREAKKLTRDAVLKREEKRKAAQQGKTKKGAKK